MSSNAKRLGAAVLKRRRDLDLNQQEVADAGGPSDTTLSKLENGLVEIVSRSTLRRLDVALQWRAGTARSIYDGTTQTATVEASPARTDPWARPQWMDERTHRRIVRETESFYRYKLETARDDASVYDELFGTNDAPDVPDGDGVAPDADAV